MKKVTLRYGLIAGIIAAVMMLIFMPFTGKQISYDTSEILGYISILLSLSTIFIAIKTYRDDYNDGKVKFGNAFLIGLYITLIAGTMYSLSFLIYFQFNPEFLDFVTNHVIEEMDKEGLPEAEKVAQLAEMTKQMEMYKNPIAMFLFSLLIEYAPVGIVVSLIAAAILKKK
jgi:membrane protease YdiL (CAAX protease family)